MSAGQEEALNDYLRRLPHLSAWCHRQGLVCTTATQLDEAIPNFMDEMFLSGREAADGAKMPAALQHFWPELKGHMPHSWRAVAGWQKLAPARTRAPLPWMGLMALVGVGLFQDLLWVAFAMMLQFVCYLRPSELLSLTPECLIPPGPLRHGAVSSWALLLRPFELGIAAKSGDFDESIVIDRPDLPWFDTFLGLLRRRPRKRAIWSFSQAQYAAQVQRLAHSAKLTDLHLDTYSITHGGASDDALERRRP